MTLTLLKKYVKELQNLYHGQIDQAEAIKIKATEALKVLFPTDIVFIGEFSRIRFQSYTVPDYEMFKKSRSQLISMLEAKIELLEHRSATAQEATIKNVIEVREIREERRVLKLRISELEEENQRILNEHAQNLDELNETLVSNDELASQLNLISGQLDKETKKRQSVTFWKGFGNWVFWGIIITIIGGAYKIGYDNGKSQYYRNEILYNKQIDSLKDVINFYDFNNALME